MTPQRVQRTYLVLTLLQTLAASLIWGVNTLFLLDAGLSAVEEQPVTIAQHITRFFTSAAPSLVDTTSADFPTPRMRQLHRLAVPPT